MKSKKLLIGLSIFIGSTLSSKVNTYAEVSVQVYNSEGVPTEFIDKESPPAYKITGSPYFPNGTILYKQEYKDITYYAPNPPLGSDEAKGVSKSYINWGFWDFPLNQKVYKYGQSGADKLFESHFYYPQVKILKKTLVETTHGKDGANSIDVGYVNAGTVLNVLSITKQTYGTEIFFKLNQIPGMSSGTNVGKIMVGSGNVQYLGTKKDIYFSESANRSSNCRYYTDNFKPYTKPTNINGNNSHNDLILTSSAEKSSSARVPDGTSVGRCSIGGRYGEWRYLGLSSNGTPLANPYFPEDQLSYRGNATLSSYDWRKTPWRGDDKEGSKEKDPIQNADIFVKQYNSPTKYDSSAYLDKKKQVLKKLYDNGILSSSDWTLDDFANRVSLLTHPTKETAVFVGQRKGGAWDKMFMFKNPARDLYMANMKVKDKEGNVILEGSGSANEFSFKQSKSGMLKKGETYIVQVILGNATSQELSVDALSAQMGSVNGSSNAPLLTLPYGMTHTQMGIQLLKSRGGIKGQANSISSAFEFELSISENYSSSHIDVYGYVGKYHAGVDNLNYDNDTGVLRGYFDKPPILDEDDESLPEDLGDLMAYKIEFYDGNTLVYERNYTGTVSVKNAIIPSKKYKMKYTAKYTGEDLWDYKWVEPYYIPVQVWVPGHWETEEYWVSGYWATRKVWVSGYTNSYGEWVPGYWKTEEYWVSGYWDSYEIWVSGYYTTEYELVPGYWEKDKISEYTIPIEYTITRKVGKNQSLDSKTASGYFKTSSGSTSIPMKNNTYIYFETNEVMFEHPYMYTQFKIDASNSRFNSSRSNDTLSATIEDTFDIKISNLKVLPNTEYTDGNSKKLSQTVIYDAYLQTPSYVSSSDYQAYVDTSININGTAVNVVDVLMKGDNKNITHVIDNVSIPGNISGYTTNVVLNYNRESYESGNYSNNSASYNTKLEQIKNPSSGNSSSVASSVNNSNNNSSPNRGGDANNNCLVPRTKNTFISTYNIRKWNSNSVSYTTFNTGSTITFNKYYTESTSSKTSTNTESFEITEVMFKSKNTVDEKLGDKQDGWINLLNARQKDLALIKAGYGFELKVKVEYKTNALLNNPKWSASKNSGTSVTNVSSGINIIPELFVELPGENNNRKILSVSGYKDSVQGLLVNPIKSNVVEDGNQVYSWEYTIKPTKTVGIKEVGKIFIPEDMKNGKYKVSIYTPPVTGVSSSPEYSTSKYSALCDRKDVQIEVKGSYTDDLNSHHTQY